MMDWGRRGPAPPLIPPLFENRGFLSDYYDSIEITFEDGSRMWLRYDYNKVQYDCGVFK